MQLIKARNIAIEICKILQPFCVKDRIHIAGSIRREKDFVKDIEIVCLPQKLRTGSISLFDDDPGIEIIDQRFSDNVKSLGKIVMGKVTGKQMKIELPEGILLDLFMPDDFDFYREYAIRTGSAKYSFFNIAYGWKKVGWCGSDKGLRKQSDCIFHKSSEKDKGRWICKNPDAEKPPVWQSEKEFFEWIKVEWLHPKYRSL